MWISDVSQAIQGIEQASIQLTNKSSDAAICIENIDFHVNVLRQLFDNIDVNYLDRKVLEDVLACVHKKAEI